MAGANYMGGKRNLARARNRDVVRKMQTRHFLKQQHQILTHNLQNGQSKAEEQASLSNHHRAEIDLAHARKDIQRRYGSAGSQQSRGPCKPMKGLFSSESSSSPRRKSQTKPSKILNALEDSDPGTYREMLNRLAHCTDLAGLTKVAEYSCKGANPTRSSGEDATRKRQKTTHELSNVPSSPAKSVRSQSSSELIPFQHLREGGFMRSQFSNKRSTGPVAQIHNMSVDSPNYQSRTLGRTSVAQQLGSSRLGSDFSVLDFVDDVEELDQDDRNAEAQMIEQSDSLSLQFSASPHQRARPALVVSEISSLPPSSEIPESRSRSAVSPHLPSLDEDMAMTRSPIQVNEVSLLQLSDPWRALDDILCIPVSAQHRAFEGDPLEGFIANDRSGVGYNLAEAEQANAVASLPPQFIFPDLDTEDDFLNNVYNREDGSKRASVHLESQGNGLKSQSSPRSELRERVTSNDLPLFLPSSGTMFDTVSSFLNFDVHASSVAHQREPSWSPDRCSTSHSLLAGNEKSTGPYADIDIIQPINLIKLYASIDTQCDGMEQKLATRAISPSPRFEEPNVPLTLSQLLSQTYNNGVLEPTTTKTNTGVEDTQEHSDQQEEVIEGPQLFADDDDDDLY